MALEHACYEPYIMPEVIDQTWIAIQDVLCQHPVDFEEMRQVLDAWRALLVAPFRPGARLIPLHVRCWVETIRLSNERLSLAWLCPDFVLVPTQASSVLTGEESLKAIPEINVMHVMEPGYGPCTHQPVFIHFFSGRRRCNDLQDELEKLNWDHCWRPVIISLDIVLDAQHGDLMKERNRAWWLDLIRSGHIDGVVMGPPCESWSLARERWRTEGWGPQPLRSRSELWGLSVLLIKQVQQILFGNTLLQFCVLAYFLQWARGKFAVLEHPAPPSEDHPEPPSIWFLTALKLLAMLPQSRLELINQGHFGAVSPKPTALLCAAAPAPLSAFSLQFRTRSSLPPPLKMGKDSSGVFNTFQLKEYPQGLNRLLSSAFHWWTLQGQHTPSTFDQAQLDVIQKFLSSIGQGSAGPDFAN